MQSEAKAEAIRLLKWVRENRADWEKICGAGSTEDISDEDMYRLMSAMISNGFYQIALVLLAAYEVRPKSEQALFCTFIDTLMQQENGDSLEQFFQGIIANSR